MAIHPVSGIPPDRPLATVMGVHAWLLLACFAASFGVVFFARDLHSSLAGWPLGFWLAAQGSVFVFIAIVAGFA